MVDVGGMKPRGVVARGEGKVGNGGRGNRRS